MSERESLIAAREAEERLAAARARINRVIVALEGWEYKNMVANHCPFLSEQRALREALDLLDPKVKLA